MKFPHLWNQLFNTPLILSDATANTFASVFLQIIQGGGSINVASVQATETQTPDRESFASTVASARFSQKKYIVTDSGIGILPVYGVLAQRSGQINADCTPMASYERLGMTFRAMMADADVRGILMEIDSPGGQVSGNFDFARSIMAARQVKPIWAHANEMALSGGYSLAAAAERLMAPRTGNLGSIGVIMQHVSQVAKDAKAGYEYTTIKSGAQKDLLNPHRALSKADLQWAQSQVDNARDMFAQLVADGRGLAQQAVLDTEAGIFSSADAKQLGLLDDIATFAETLAAFEKRVASGVVPVSSRVTNPAAKAPTNPPQEKTMSGNQAAPAAPATPTAATETPAPAATAPAAPAAPPAAAPAAAAAEAPAVDAAAAERTRIAAITGSDEAKGRSQLASHIAFNTAMSADDAKKLLAASPKEAGASPLAAAMAGVPNPAVGTDAPNPAAAGVPVINTANVYSLRSKQAHGIK